MYIYECGNWPNFIWDSKKIENILTKVSFAQGRILGKMQELGFNLQQEAILTTLTEEIIKSSEIEGEILNIKQVRSSIARRLNIHNENSINSSHHIDGIVNMMIDATHNFNNPLTLERLYGWHAALFPTGYSGIYKIKVAALRDDKEGPMQVISTKGNREIVYYQAPNAKILPEYMKDFLNWINTNNTANPLIRAAISHLWFITLHPFEDGNGRIARAITDMMLAKAENTAFRFYSMSSQIQKEKNEYYKVLEYTQKGDLDITNWIIWFLECLLLSIKNSEQLIADILKKAKLWQQFNQIKLDNTQIKMINMLLDGFEGNLTSSKWAKICKCSQDTATRSINYLVENRILKQQGAGRSTHYVINCEE
ncbi:MAG: Fic family protein [Alphaproteobacteria bacterium]|nr:Fic family protein [Alphaproteobacteria bacterium]